MVAFLLLLNGILKFIFVSLWLNSPVNTEYVSLHGASNFWGFLPGVTSQALLSKEANRVHMHRRPESHRVSWIGLYFFRPLSGLTALMSGWSQSAQKHCVA